MKEILEKYKNYFETELAKHLDKLSLNKILIDSIRYGLENGGKRIRPILCFLGAELLDGKKENVLSLALAVEMIHCYSLVHDDLPSMDNDNLRRGKPTTHIKFGEGNAVLAGDALLNFAYETMLLQGRCDKQFVDAMREISLCAGVGGMIEGQSIDINEIDKINFTKEDFLYLYTKKTSCLLKAGLLSGAIATGANKSQCEALEKFAQNLGIVFQIVDDILDITSSAEVLGKNVGSDSQNNKTTLVSHLGLEASKIALAKFERNSLEALKIFGKKGEVLKELCLYLTKRSF